MVRPTHVLVVVPAHDEEHLVGACMVSVAVARQELAAVEPDVDVSVTLVLDACTDQTAARALEHAGAHGVHLLAVEARCVGAARAAGVGRAKASVAAAAESVWVTTTDADSRVDPHWLVDHVRLAEHHDVVLGRVEPASEELHPTLLAEWRRRHELGWHVHGANLGVRLSTYERVGGFRALAVHEDVALVDAARAAGATIGHGSVVTTSARTTGRVHGGFATYLDELGTSTVDAGQEPA